MVEIRSVLRSQYLAALTMLRDVIARCPAELWTAETETNPFWRVAYHVVWYTHFYLHPSPAAFVPWAKQRPDYEALGDRLDYPPYRTIAIGDPYTPADVLEYWDVCREAVDRLLPALDLAGPSGFEWLPFGKLELQLYNIRHVQHHTGELADRLGRHAGLDVPWVGLGR